MGDPSLAPEISVVYGPLLKPLRKILNIPGAYPALGSQGLGFRMVGFRV